MSNISPVCPVCECATDLVLVDDAIANELGSAPKSCALRSHQKTSSINGYLRVVANVTKYGVFTLLFSFLIAAGQWQVL
ncbi:hypothetical protein KIN20_027075 [Parelaphostrongylus tenuis]|uniref:Uncharacterized protein n=1 Tax=Parelaphostrongylus tenuis TaxID=148309 RepID=A0AAD5QZ47_PARTN|nr:hypothetical protein KIN20_027075 [Parelaphostrongylus tenuis]